MFQAPALELLEVEDYLSPEKVASTERMRSAGFILRNDLPRFRWCLDTREKINAESFDLFAHVSWLLAQLKPSVSLEEARDRGVELFLSLYYAGNGTGGGPLISQELAELLAHRGISMQVGFYYEDSNAV
ncbi:MAG: hypothetical protein KGL40_02710 [Rhodocyclaceae bacterium]|nr:hypothetical protein [Rhodocyclaceae bacterium]